MTEKISVNIICGPLGSGKTTLVRHFLNHKPAEEKWALLVNEFGSVGIDGAILSETGNLLVKQMPGGCICCTAQADLKTAIHKLLDSHRPQRLIIEPTGLGEPDTLVDLFTDPDLSPHFSIETLFGVLDVANTDLAELENLTIMQSLTSMADVLVLNKTDMATQAQLNTLSEFCDQLYPPKQFIVKTEQAKIDISLINLQHKVIAGFKFTPNTPTLSPLNTSAHQAHLNDPVSHTLPYEPNALAGLTSRLYKKQLDVESIGWIFSAETTFDWPKLNLLFQTMGEISPNLPGLVKRAKGVFRIGKPWMLFQYVNQQSTREYIAYRKDSRIEILLDAKHPFDYLTFEEKLQDCIK